MQSPYRTLAASIFQLCHTRSGSPWWCCIRNKRKSHLWVSASNEMDTWLILPDFSLQEPFRIPSTPRSLCANSDLEVYQILALRLALLPLLNFVMTSDLTNFTCMFYLSSFSVMLSFFFSSFIPQHLICSSIILGECWRSQSVLSSHSVLNLNQSLNSSIYQKLVSSILKCEDFLSSLFNVIVRS